MPKAALLQTGFNTGEVSPLCYGVCDNPRYKKGLAVGLNFIPTLQGPIIRRPGTRYVNDVKDSTNPPVLIPFSFSATQNYILEFGANYVRFYANNGQIVTSSASFQVSGYMTPTIGVQIVNFNFFATRATINPQPQEIVTAHSAVTSGSVLELASPYAAADLSLIRWAQNGDTLYLVHPKYPPYKLTRSGNTLWKLQTVFLIDGPYLPANSYLSIGDNANYQLVPQASVVNGLVTAATLASISGAVTDPGGSGQIQITTASAHGVSNGQKIFISGVTGTVEANNWSNAPGRTVPTGASFWIANVTSTTTLLLIGSVFTNGYAAGGTIYPAIFASSAAQAEASTTIQDQGRAIALVQDGIRYWGYITQVLDAATVHMLSLGDTAADENHFPNGDTSTEWFLGTYSGGGVGAAFVGNGYPSAVSFHQNRLWFAGCTNSPQEVDASGSNSFEDFAASDRTTLNVKDNNALSFNLSSDDLNPIRWMASTAQGLLAGNYSAEWAMTPSTAAEALTPTNFNAQQTSFYGSAAIAPAKIGNAVMYIQRAARKLREITYSFYGGTFRSSDLTEISEHISLPGFTKIGVQKENQPLIWALRSDGVLTSLIYNRDDVSLSVGWTRHQLAGISDGSNSPAQVYDFAFIPDPAVSFDQMWLVVKRWNLPLARYEYTVEYMAKIPDDSIAQADSVIMDASGVYNGAPTTTVTGLTWVAGQTVGVLTDGGLHPDCVVSPSGVITLNYPASKIQVGLRFNSQGQLLRAEAGAADGTSIGKTRRTTRVAIQLHRTGDLAIGTSFDNLIPINFAQADQNQADTAVPLFSGMIREGVESAYDFESQLCFQMSSPLPGTIQSITSFLEEFDI